MHGVNITTEIAGLVRSVNFRSGEDAQARRSRVEEHVDGRAVAHQLPGRARGPAQVLRLGLVYGHDSVAVRVPAYDKAVLPRHSAMGRRPFHGATSSATEFLKPS